MATRTHTDIRVTAQRTFFHVDVTDAGVQDDFFQPRKVFVGFLGRGDIGLTHDFDQGHSAAVQIDRRLFLRIGKTFVQTLPGIFFEVQPRDANLLGSAGGRDLDPAVLG